MRCRSRRAFAGATLGRLETVRRTVSHSPAPWPRVNLRVRWIAARGDASLAPVYFSAASSLFSQSFRIIHVSPIDHSADIVM